MGLIGAALCISAVVTDEKSKELINTIEVLLFIDKLQIIYFI